MEWREEGFMLGARRLGETSVIAEVMTRGHGRALGVVRGGRSRRMQPVLQVGNSVEATWRARLDEQLGTFVIEPVTMRAGEFLSDPFALHAVQLLAGHLRLLPERDPHERLFDAFALILTRLDDPAPCASLLLRFELLLLEELGFGLDLSRCALTGADRGLAFVSPRTGRAVTAEAGARWADRLLPLPSFLSKGALDEIDEAVSPADLRAGFALAGHFLARHLWDARGLAEPDVRASVEVAATDPRPGIGTA